MLPLELTYGQLFKKPGDIRWLTFLSARPLTTTSHVGSAGEVRVFYQHSKGTYSLSVPPTFEFEVPQTTEA